MKLVKIIDISFHYYLLFYRHFLFYIFTEKSHHLTLYHKITFFKDPVYEAFENIVEKGENAGNQHFLLFQQCFLPFPKQILIPQLNLICCLQMLSIWTCVKFCNFFKELSND